MEEYLIVSGDQAIIRWIRAQGDRWAEAPVIETATANDVKGKIVAGNLSLALAAAALELWNVEFGRQAAGGESAKSKTLEQQGIHFCVYICHRYKYKKKSRVKS